jgi:hypothetical protein
MKAFFTFNRNDTTSLICLYNWLEIFKDYDVTLVCDLYDVARQPKPSYLSNIPFSFKVINTNYKLGEILPFKARKRMQASAKLTCFEQARSEGYFWMVDADDTMFLTRNLDLIREKLKRVEQLSLEKNLDGFSLDFYRETHHDHWSFGLSFLKSNISFDLFKQVTPEDTDTIPGLTKNLDSWFDVLRRRKILKLESYVFDNIPFQHNINPMSAPMHGIYLWNNRILNGVGSLREDVISI